MEGYRMLRVIVMSLWGHSECNVHKSGFLWGQGKFNGSEWFKEDLSAKLERAEWIHKM